MSLDDERAQINQHFTHFEARLDEHEELIHALRTVPGELDGLKQQVQNRLTAQDTQLASILRTLERIEPVVNDVRDNRTARRVAMDALKATAAVIVALGVIFGAINYMFNPHGIHIGRPEKAP